MAISQKMTLVSITETTLINAISDEAIIRRDLWQDTWSLRIHRMASFYIRKLAVWHNSGRHNIMLVHASKALKYPKAPPPTRPQTKAHEIAMLRMLPRCCHSTSRGLGFTLRLLPGSELCHSVLLGASAGRWFFLLTTVYHMVCWIVTRSGFSLLPYSWLFWISCDCAVFEYSHGYRAYGPKTAERTIYDVGLPRFTGKSYADVERSQYAS